MTIKFSVTKVKELMTPNPVVVSPDATLAEAARQMEAVNCGVLPVGTEQGLDGIITDRDIVIRAVAAGLDPAREKVSDHMTAEVHGCNENDSLEAAAEKMHQYKINRLIVKDGGGRATGILSFGRFLRVDASAEEIASCIKGAASA